MPTRAEHRHTTLRALSDAAVDAFEERGAVATVDDIAARAGVSRRTVFRWVDAKEELAFLHPVLWFDVFDDALERLDPTLPTAERLRRASRAIALHIDADPEPPRRAFLVAAAHPGLTSGYGAVYQRWIDRVAAEVMPDHPDDHDRFRARIVGSAVMGMVDAVMRAWIVAPSQGFTELYDEAFEMIEPLFGP